MSRQRIKELNDNLESEREARGWRAIERPSTQAKEWKRELNRLESHQRNKITLTSNEWGHIVLALVVVAGILMTIMWLLGGI